MRQANKEAGAWIDSSWDARMMLTIAPVWHEIFLTFRHNTENKLEAKICGTDVEGDQFELTNLKDEILGLAQITLKRREIQGITYADIQIPCKLQGLVMFFPKSICIYDVPASIGVSFNDTDNSAQKILKLPEPINPIIARWRYDGSLKTLEGEYDPEYMKPVHRPFLLRKS